MNQMMGNQGNINNQNMNNFMLNLINQNIQMANQIAINNNILKTLIENPSSFNNINNLFQADNPNISGNNQIAFKNINMNTMNKNLKDLIDSIDFFPGKSNNKCNVYFENPSGLRINMIVPRDVKMSDLIYVFYIKLQMIGYKIKKLDDYIFLFNGYTVSLNEQKNIYEYD